MQLYYTNNKKYLFGVISVLANLRTSVYVIFVLPFSVPYFMGNFICMIIETRMKTS